MELKIVNPHSENISVKFGISNERKEALASMIEEIYNRICITIPATPLVAIYQEVAERCDTIEEYTMCMHMLLFNISKIGKPIDDFSIKN